VFCMHGSDASGRGDDLASATVPSGLSVCNNDGDCR